MRPRPIEYRDLPRPHSIKPARSSSPDGIRDGWPLDTQHFGEQILGDRQCVIVAAVTHHEQPTRQPLLEVCAPLHATDTRTCSRKAST